MCKIISYTLFYPILTIPLQNSLGDIIPTFQVIQYKYIEGDLQKSLKN